MRRTAAGLCVQRVGLVRVDAELLEGRLRRLGAQVASTSELGDCRGGNVRRVDLEVAPERLARVGPAEAVRAERYEGRIDPRPNEIRQRLHPVGGGDDGAALRTKD